MALLEVNDIHTYYGAIHALKGLSVHVDKGEIVTLIGANGAGKSTTLNTICGIYRPRQGTILLQDQPIHELPAHEIVMLGVSQAPEGRRVFGRLNVTENLEMVDVHTYYGNIHALKGVSLHVDKGEIVTLIGSNGAGKSTTLRTISGTLKPRQGTVMLNGKRIDEMPAHEIVALGVAQSPEGRRVFSRMTVFENLELGAFSRKGAKLDDDIDRVYELFPRLKERRTQRAGTMSGGEQQMLAIGRALMASPRLLLLDEPSMGLAPILVEVIFDTIREINAQGITILLVEQNALMALSVANRGYVLETGAIVLAGTGQELLNNPQVMKAYLGG